jgi:zinc transporter ZupT
MIAASCFGLIIPAMKFAGASGLYGAHSWVPAVIGVMLGAAFVHAADLMIPHDAADTVTVLTGEPAAEEHDEDDIEAAKPLTSETSELNSHDHASVKMHLDEPRSAAIEMQEVTLANDKNVVPAGQDVAAGSVEAENEAAPDSSPVAATTTSNRQCSESSKDESKDESKQPELQASATSATSDASIVSTSVKQVVCESSASQLASTSASEAAEAAAAAAAIRDPITGQTALERRQSWRRILLLVIAIVIHNFPEGLAVGVGFGALATVKTHEPASTSEVDILAAQKLTDDEYNSVFDSAKTLAIGIGLQNFPEGLAVSLPLMRVGYSRTRAFWWGQLSGMVEPIGGVLGAGVITYMQPLLPYALSFAAGAMIFVVVHDILPETRAKGGYPMLACWFIMAGFALMMAMDVALG